MVLPTGAPNRTHSTGAISTRRVVEANLPLFRCAEFIMVNHSVRKSGWAASNGCPLVTRDRNQKKNTTAAEALHFAKENKERNMGRCLFVPLYSSFGWDLPGVSATISGQIQVLS